MKKIIKFLSILLLILVTIFSLFLFFNPWGINLNTVLTFKFPQRESKILIEDDSSYFVKIKDKNIYKQGKNQCGAFSTCFVLRNLGIEKYGEDVYNSMSPKLKNGYLMPQSII